MVREREEEEAQEAVQLYTWSYGFQAVAPLRGIYVVW